MNDDQPREESLQEEQQSSSQVFLTAVLFEAGLGALALILGRWIGPDPRSSLPRVRQWDQVSETAAQVLPAIGMGLLAAVPMLIAIGLIRRLPLESIRRLERLSDTPTMKTLLGLRPAEMIAISLCAGVGEELLFRGWLMSAILDGYHAAPGIPADAIAPVVVAVAISSIIFGAVHWITNLYAVLATAMGVYFGCLYYFTGNLLVPIFAHAGYDAVQFLYGAWEERRKAAGDPS